MTFAEKLLKLRKKAGLSQEELAAKLNVSRQAVSRWELGAALPDASNLLQISTLFGVTADYLLHDEWEEEQAPPMARTARRPHSERAVRAVLVGLHAVALCWEWLGWSAYEPGWPFLVGVTLALLDIIGFEVWMSRLAGQRAGGARICRRRYYRRSVWLFALFPVRLLCRAAGQLWPRPYPALAGKAVGVLAYLLVCAAVTWLLREQDGEA